MPCAHQALGRALSSWMGRGAHDLRHLLDGMAFELQSVMSSELTAIAIVVKIAGESHLIGRCEERFILPAETLIGLLADGENSGSCRVRDHALDAVRLLDNRFRSSLLAGIVIPKNLIRHSQACLWFGVSGCATSHAISEAEGIARDVSEWLEWYCPVIEASMKISHERDTARRKVYDMVSVVHDARAPLGMLKYLLRAGPAKTQEDPSLLRELEYLEKLLALCAPAERGNRTSSCDVSQVLARVCSRYERQQLKGRISWQKGYDPLYARVVDLDLERIASNVLSNAVRHAPGSQVEVSFIRQDQRVVISIADNGPGISPDVLEKLRQGRGLPFGGDLGWGIGLQSSRERILSVGGELQITSHVGQGTVVLIYLEALGEISDARPTLCVADAPIVGEAAYHGGSIFLVDDDVEHAHSLARILQASGHEAIVCESLQSLLAQSDLSPHAVVICDARMPDGGAEELLKIFAKRETSPRVGVMSGDAGEDLLYRFAALGAQAFFAKPVEHSDLTTWLRGLKRGAEGREAA